MQKKIMTVDDSPTVRKVLCMALSAAGYQVIEASDGRDALKCVESHSIDLLITDLKMPNMDGLDLIRELRRRPGLQYLPIIMLTGESGEDCRTTARDAGVSAFIVKPFVPEQIAGLIRGIFT